MDPNNQNSLEDSSLESTETVIEPSTVSSSVTPSITVPTTTPLDNSTSTTSINSPKPKLFRRFFGRFKSFNIYLILFGLIIVVGIFIMLVTLRISRKAATSTTSKNTPADQTLSTSTLNNIADSNPQVGDSKQTLTIASNTIFGNRVLMRDNLDVAGTIHVGGSVNLAGVTVSGTSNFDTLQVANSLAVNGSTTIQGDITSKGKLSIGGGASFGGAISAPTITIDKLNLSQDISLSRHITTGGGTPGVAQGTGVGNGGTVSLSGSDTAGTISINIGNSPVAGVLANVSFSVSFSKTPHVVVTPIGSAAGALDYYVTRTGTGFTIAVTSAATAGTSFAFDYIVIN